MEKLMALAATSSAAFSIWGGWDSLLLFLLVVIAIDYITGVIAAGVKGKISSTIGLKGIARKIFIFALVAIANIIDTVLGSGSFIRNATIIFYLSNEMISIIENAGAVGVPIPKILARAIESLRSKKKE